MRQRLGYSCILLALLLTITLGACGAPTLTPAEQATATAGAARATFQSLPAADQQATMAIVVQTINAGLNPTPELP